VISIVLPAYNEAQNIATITARLGELVAPLGRYEIIFVDDGSTDETLAELQTLSARNRAVRYVSFTRNFGHQAALRAGLRHARGNAVVLMDCDFEHPPETVPALVAEWRRGAKVVLTQRLEAAESASLLKRVTSRWFYRLLDAIGDVRIEPGSSDFLLLDREVVDAINGLSNQGLFLRGLVRWLGYRRAKVTFVPGVRRQGEPKFTLRRMLDLAMAGVVAHSVLPLRVASYLAIALLVAGIAFGALAIAGFLWIGGDLAGWTSILSVIALVGAGQMLVVGIIGEYIGRILREARDWPAYIVAETNAPEDSETQTLRSLAR
jgi:polyisoprenyl-phosphate glycosyltransferase